MQNEKILVFTDRKANVDRLETILRRLAIKKGINKPHVRTDGRKLDKVNYKKFRCFTHK